MDGIFVIKLLLGVSRLHYYVVHTATTLFISVDTREARVACRRASREERPVPANNLLPHTILMYKKRFAIFKLLHR